MQLVQWRSANLSCHFGSRFPLQLSTATQPVSVILRAVLLRQAVQIMESSQSQSSPPDTGVPGAPPGIAPQGVHPREDSSTSNASHPHHNHVKHGSGASGSQPPPQAAAGHRGPGSVVPPVAQPSASAADASASAPQGSRAAPFDGISKYANVFYRPRGDEHDPE